MDIRKIKKLIELLEESGIAEIEIKEGEEALRISRMPTGAAASHHLQHVAGLLAGTRGLPITVLHVGARAKQQEGRRLDEESHEAVVREAATAIGEADPESAGDVELTTRARTQKAADAVVEEARKGFDLLVVGMENVLGKDGFDKKVEDVGGLLLSLRQKASTSSNPRERTSGYWFRFPEAPYRDAVRRSRARWRVRAPVHSEWFMCPRRGTKARAGATPACRSRARKVF